MQKLIKLQGMLSGDLRTKRGEDMCRPAATAGRDQTRRRLMVVNSPLIHHHTPGLHTEQ
jgi:hypothetical protein